MIIKSLDPRITRAHVDDQANIGHLEGLDHWQTYEVFAQTKRGQQHAHVGSVHAPNPEMALILAKEQYTRRGTTVNLWVARTSDIFATEYEDADIFETTPEKWHRDPESYKVMDRIKAFKEKQAQKA